MAVITNVINNSDSLVRRGDPVYLDGEVTIRGGSEEDIDNALKDLDGKPFRADRDYKEGDYISIPLLSLSCYYYIGGKWIHRSEL